MNSEKKKGSKKAIMITVGVIIVIVLLAIVGRRILVQDFDAKAYVSAMLDQTFKGDEEALLTIVEGTTQKALNEQYEAEITDFVEKNIAVGVNMDDEMKAKHIALCKDIFGAMKYSVGEAEKISNSEYRVPVKYQTADIFTKFMAAEATEYARIMEKVQKGEYKGETQEENDLQMKQEYLNNTYEMLKRAYEEVQYAKAETIVFTVKKNEDGVFTLDSKQIYEFTTKIMGFDEIQD